MIISFSGHRDIGGEISIRNKTYVKVEQEVEKLLLELKPESCISGAALGFDQLAAEICINLNIPITLAIPFRSQESAWPKEAQRKYFNLLEKAQNTVIICEGSYASWKFQKRNEYMVDNCDTMIFYLKNTERSGTLNCFNYAKLKNKTIHMINDET